MSANPELVRAWLLRLAALAMLLRSALSYGQIGALPTGSSNLQSGTDSKYQIGDVWEYKTRSGEQRSRFTIVKIDKSSKLGTIIHIAVDGLTWKTCQGGLLPEQVPHMPFSREAIEGSATRRVARNHSLPKYEEGYEEWRNAFLNGHAGIYTISIKDAVSVAEKTWRIGVGCGKSSQ